MDDTSQPCNIRRTELIRELEKQPLRNVVLLKHLLAFPDHTEGYRVAFGGEAAWLVLLDTRASAYDRATYPTAAHAAMVTSDIPDLTTRLLDFLPEGRGIVFKLASLADRDAVAKRFRIEAKARFVSFTAGRAFHRDTDVQVTSNPSEAALSLFEAQGHTRTWLRPLLALDKAFACCLHVREGLGSVCLAFESCGQVWEVGGVITPEAMRGRGLAARVVSTALAVLAERSLTPRYQVHGENNASLEVARKLGMQHFLTLKHYIYSPT